ncbi:MAG: amino acid ABC transporter permease, partial [Candidatus Eremiobacteraeota bacterium]|nr:amino acid ABC transporter permease [Candidatus Eremiobacteraeota bacterium]
MSEYLSSLPDILTRGLEFTLVISFCAMLITVAGGLLLGVLRALHNRFLDAVIIAYVEVLRGIPLLVLMFFVFFGLPQLGIHLVPSKFRELQSVVAAIVALGLWGAANGTEIVRGAIFSISRGQTEAGTALGLNWFQVMSSVILPQALRRMIPPFMSLFTAIVESSSLAALIGVFDLLETVRTRVETAQQLWFPLLLTVMLIYFFINYP